MLDFSPPNIYHEQEDSVTISREYFEELKQKASSPRKRTAHGWRKPYKVIPGERWMYIDFTGKEYKVSSLGRVMHVGTKTICANVMINQARPQQYVLLKYKNGIKRYCSVKNLVYSMFSITKHSGVVYHIDGNPTNNRFNNLACRQRMKRQTPPATKIRKYLSKKGIWKSKPSVLSTIDMEDIHKLLVEGVPQIEIAKRFGVSQGYISRIHISACRK